MFCRADVGYPESARWLLALAFVTAEPVPSAFHARMSKTGGSWPMRQLFTQ
jgi:hypothetical protein